MTLFERHFLTPPFSWWTVCPVVVQVLALAAHKFSKEVYPWLQRLPAASAMTLRGFLRGTPVGVLLLAFVLSPGGEQAPFIYFQF